MRSLTHIISCLLILSWAANTLAQTGHRTLSYNDPDRNNRNVGFEFYYPAESSGDNAVPAGTDHPLVVVGHGFVMTVDVYDYLWESLVPAGYAVALVTTEGGIFPSHQDFGLDLRFVADRLIGVENQAPQSDWYGYFNGRAAVMGHSMGGGAGVIAAANDSGTFSAYIGLAPAETNPSAIALGQAVYPELMSLVLSGDSDGVTPPQDHHIPIYGSLNADCKFFVNYIGGSHCYFATEGSLCDLGEFNPGSLSRQDQLNATTELVLAFLDFSLGQNPLAFQTMFSYIANTPWLELTDDCAVVSVEEIDLNELHPAPNPFTEFIRLGDKEAVVLGMTDLEGRKIPIRTSYSGNEIIVNPEQEIVPGIYILSWTTNGRMQTARVIKE